jgi:hypothetical protein
VLTETFGLLQHGNVEIGHPAARTLLLLDQPGQLDGAGESSRSSTDDHHVHVERLIAEDLL